MKHTYLPLIVILTLAACQPANELDTKKKELETAKGQLLDLKDKIAQLEADIRKSDPTFGKTNNAVIVSVFTADKKVFEHFMEVRGSVTSKRNVNLSSTLGGRIESVSAKEGQSVRAGQVLVTTEGDVLRKSIAEIKTQWELANTAFQKQEKLWQQKIGTEMQYLQVKNTKESLEKRMATTQAQLDQTMVRAPFDGVIDVVDALEGEMAAPGMPLVRMVSNSGMFVKADVSEDYLGKFNAGQKADIFFPTFDKSVVSTVSAIGQTINPENRTYEVEFSVSLAGLKANQVAVVKLRDYVSPSAFAVPTKIILRDNTGQFIYVVEAKGDATVAKKLYVSTGTSYNSFTEITKGLNGGERVILEGVREVAEGLEVKVTDSKEVASK